LALAGSRSSPFGVAFFFPFVVGAFGEMAFVFF
jgi:hypothetical protein